MRPESGLTNEIQGRGSDGVTVVEPEPGETPGNADKEDGPEKGPGVK